MICSIHFLWWNNIHHFLCFVFSFKSTLKVSNYLYGISLRRNNWDEIFKMRYIIRDNDKLNWIVVFLWLVKCGRNKQMSDKLPASCLSHNVSYWYIWRTLQVNVSIVAAVVWLTVQKMMRYFADIQTLVHVLGDCVHFCKTRTTRVNNVQSICFSFIICLFKGSWVHFVSR